MKTVNKDQKQIIDMIFELDQQDTENIEFRNELRD